MNPLIVITAADIRLDGLALDEPLPASWIDAAISDASLAVGAGDWEAKSNPAGGRVKGRLSRSDQDVVVRCRVSAEVTLACSRCLAPVPIPVDADLSLLLQPSTRPELSAGPGGSRRGRSPAAKGDAEKEYEFSTEEADSDLFDGEVVVLDSFIREAILLELPQFPLCSEGCVGIGAADADPRADAKSSPEEVVDPRLAPLHKLRSKLRGEPPLDDVSALGPMGSIPRKLSPKKPMLRSTTRRGLGAGRKKAKRKE